MASRNSKSKSSGLRMLWIPGGRKNHPKGRFDATNKQVSGYGPKQKKSEVWSLGGGRAQKDLLNAEPDTRLLDGPSTSTRLAAPVTSVLSVAGAATTITTEPNTLEINNTSETPSRATTPLPALPTEATAVPIETKREEIQPVPLNTSTPNSTEATTPTMPAKTINTTTAEIMDENRFSILGKDNSEEFDIYDLPSVPKDDAKTIHNMLLNSSADTTATAATTPSSPKSDNADDNKDDAVQSKKKLHHRNHNNNHKQDDINSIESISVLKPLNTNFDWIDELYLERNGKAVMQRNKRKKKKTHASTKEMDQLDGVPSKPNTSEPSTDEDEKVVKCLYYTLMCCDCTIS